MLKKPMSFNKHGDTENIKVSIVKKIFTNQISFKMNATRDVTLSKMLVT